MEFSDFEKGKLYVVDCNLGGYEVGSRHKYKRGVAYLCTEADDMMVTIEAEHEGECRSWITFKRQDRWLEHFSEVEIGPAEAEKDIWDVL